MAIPQARSLEIQGLEAHLKAQFHGSIKGVGHGAESVDRNYLSKAAGAFFLMAYAGVSFSASHYTHARNIGSRVIKGASGWAGRNRNSRRLIWVTRV